MSAHFPDVETIRSALMLAVRAPSVHNSQPWLWRVGDHSLHLYANRDLHLPQIDPDARDLMLSCGATLHHCQVAFAALGWQSKVRRFPNPADPESPGGHRTSPISGFRSGHLFGRRDPATTYRPQALHLVVRPAG